MTPQKVIEVLGRYTFMLEGNGYAPARSDPNSRISLSNPNDKHRLLCHLAWMCHEAKRFLIDSMEQYPGGTQSKIEKAMRWLGYIQGCLACLDLYTVEELRRHNMPEGEEYRP